MVRSTRGEGQTNQLRDRKVTSRQQNDQHSKCSSRVRHGQEQVCCSVTDMRQPVSSTELIGQLTRAIQSLSNQLPTARHSSPQLAIALASGLVPLGRSTRSGPIGPTQSLQRTSDPADPAEIPPGPFPVLVQPSLDFPARDWTQKDSGGGSRFARATADHRVLLLT